MSDEIHTTRIDLVKRPDDRIQVMKWVTGWTASTPPAQNYISETSLETILAWLQANNWTIHTWLDGTHVRAWRGKPLPVRTASRIKQLRDEMTHSRSYYNSLGVQLHAIDLAYDW